MGTVVATGCHDEEPPLYFSGDYRRLHADDPGTPDARIAPLATALSEQLDASGLSPPS